MQRRREVCADFCEESRKVTGAWTDPSEGLEVAYCGMALWQSSRAGNNNLQPHTTSRKRGCPNEIKTIFISLTTHRVFIQPGPPFNQKIYLQDLELPRLVSCESRIVPRRLNSLLWQWALTHSAFLQGIFLWKKDCLQSWNTHVTRSLSMWLLPCPCCEGLSETVEEIQELTVVALYSLQESSIWSASTGGNTLECVCSWKRKLLWRRPLQFRI
jgi:hypothetical protein